jgi:hypothetical protein
MPIYRKYVKNPRKFYKLSQSGYDEFLFELRKLFLSGNKIIDADTLHYLIKRHTYGIADRPNWDEKARRYYFKFWIKRAEGSGFIQQENLSWRITEKILNLES